MFVITADQIASRTHADLAGAERTRITADHGERLALPADRTAGDEIQALTADAGTCLTLILELTRTRRWSVGVGCGSVLLPLPAETREATGEAFFAARDAVIRAKKQASRFALDARPDEATQASREGSDAEAIINLLLLSRDRRTPAGWELYDLVSKGMTQLDAAEHLGITPPSASDRARVAALKSEAAAIGPLTRLLENLDTTTTRRDAAE